MSHLIGFAFQLALVLQGDATTLSIDISSHRTIFFDACHLLF